MNDIAVAGQHFEKHLGAFDFCGFVSAQNILALDIFCFNYDIELFFAGSLPTYIKSGLYIPPVIVGIAMLLRGIFP